MEINEHYLEVLKKSLLNWSEIGQKRWKPVRKGVWGKINSIIVKSGFSKYQICRPIEITFEQKLEGKDWQTSALTMIGFKRLNNIHICIKDVLKNKIPGDLIETGVWRGGATIFMRAALKAYGDNERRVFVADSFEGLPPVDLSNPKEIKIDIDPKKTLAVSLEQVQQNFREHNVLDSQVWFLKGWFKDTLPTAPIKKLAILRLDGDYYESTMDALVHLYPKLSVGGYLIIDDFALEACRNAVQDYRKLHHVTDEIIKIDWTGIYWRKSS